jgi:hypothetical protein
MHEAWWLSQSSKLMRPDDVGLGGFDSHAFPPRAIARARLLLCLCASLSLCVPVSARAQDSTAQSAARDRLPKPPISPRRAFIASAIVPGLGQSVLGRSSGLIFVTVEALSLAMYGKSKHALDVAKRFSRDSTPLSYVVDPGTGLPIRDEDGNLQVSAWSPMRFNETRVRARQTHVEDWIAMIIFNHLFAGIDAYVAAHLWQLPAQVEIRALPSALTIRSKITW